MAERRAEYRFKKIRVEDVDIGPGFVLWPWTGDYQVFATLDGALLGVVRGGTTGGPSLDGADRVDAPWMAQRNSNLGTRAFATRRAAAEWLLEQHKALLRKRDH